jgi:N-sulfoglucosamine sulfohydrolase
MSFPFSKATVYRNGTWSPVLLRWPGMGKSQKREEFVSSVDILPTLLDLLRLPPLEGVDGRSWMPLLSGESQPDRDFVITHVNTVSSGKSFPQRCVRTKDFSYQFHAWPNGTPHFRVEAMNGITYSAMAKAAENDPKIKQRVEQLTIGTPEQFFDLRNDPDERRNRVTEADLQSEVSRLKKLLLEHMKRTEDPQLAAFRECFQ